MDVDWITVAAQIINFLILVWLLKRFLYGPVIRAMDERDTRIADTLREAQEKVEYAEADADRLQDMQDALEKNREEQLSNVREEGEEYRKELQATSREEVAAQRGEWLQNLADEKTEFLEDMQQRAAQAFSEMARRALSDLANDKLEDQICQRFLKVLTDLGGDDRMRIRAECERAGASAAVHTAFDLPAQRRNEIEASLRDIVGAEIEIAFEHTTNVVCGIEFRVGGQLVRWSLDSYLDDLETELREAIERRAPEAGQRAAE